MDLGGLTCPLPSLCPQLLRRLRPPEPGHAVPILLQAEQEAEGEFLPPLPLQECPECAAGRTQPDAAERQVRSVTLRSRCGLFWLLPWRRGASNRRCVLPSGRPDGLDSGWQQESDFISS